MSQTIFITGGSGYIGSTIISQAIAQGYTVRALSRSDTSDAKLTSLGATPVRGDLTTYEVHTAEAAKADIVISMADAIAGDYTMSQEERVKTNNGAVAALAKGLEGSNKPLIITSGTLMTGADPNGNETNEDSPPWADNSFNTGIETFTLSFCDKGVKAMAVRLAPWVFGRAGSGVKLFMTRAVSTKAVIYLDGGEGCTTTVHVDDAAAMFLLVAQKGKAGQAYNAAFETNVTFKQLAEAMAKALDVPARSIPFAAAAEKMGPFLAKFLTLSSRASSAKAKKELGWKITSEKGILDEIATGSYVPLSEELKKAMA